MSQQGLPPSSGDTLIVTRTSGFKEILWLLLPHLINCPEYPCEILRFLGIVKDVEKYVAARTTPRLKIPPPKYEGTRCLGKLPLEAYTQDLFLSYHISAWWDCSIQLYFIIWAFSYVKSDLPNVICMVKTRDRTNNFIISVLTFVMLINIL